MERQAFIIELNEASKSEALAALSDGKSAIGGFELDNWSVWNIANLLLCYGEGSAQAAGGLADQLLKALGGARLLCAPGSMRLMYHDIGIVREDKALIRHRVFCTRLKPGCEEEYKRRHDALVEARGDKVSEGPDSNFTIWYGGGYIFGYDEKVKAFDHTPTEEEKAADIAWEMRQLEIMDWLTDDVDWITGEKHDAIKRIL